MIPGKAKFAKFLVDAGVPDEVQKSIGYETYGNATHAYINCKTPGDRTLLERKMEQAGMIVHKRYWPGSSTVSCRVRWFKAYGWDA